MFYRSEEVRASAGAREASLDRLMVHGSSAVLRNRMDILNHVALDVFTGLQASKAQALRIFVIRKVQDSIDHQVGAKTLVHA